MGNPVSKMKQSFDIDVEKILHGDMDEFELLYRIYFQRMVLFANKYVYDLDEAENIVQDVFVNLWVNRETLNPSKNIKMYLYIAVKNKALNVIKHLKVQRHYQEKISVCEGDHQTPESNILYKEMEQRVNVALQKLPEKCRLVFLMSRLDHLTYQEIADILGISIKTVENHMGKAIKILKTQLPHIIFMLFCAH